MKAHRIFDKGQSVYCLLASHTNPSILLPVKGIIMDSKWDPVNPLYQIRIVKFYDNMKFLKKYFFNMNFRHVFENRARKMILKSEDFKTTKSLEERLNDKDRERFYIVIESVMCTKTKVSLSKLFEKVQFYIISKNLKEIRETSARPFFKGPLSLDSVKEFDARYKKGFYDKFEKGDIDIDKYLNSLS
jgi:hypothetical protein|tara:strand:- start:1490 stop:2053 length:564 start_codon:yes stop_codon:yes gene_type:complete